MILTRRAALGGTQLDSQDASIVISGTDPGTPKETVNAVSLMGGSGQRISGRHYEMIEASVSYAINKPKKQLAARRAVFDKANAWALAKGWLTMNCMDGKRLWVENVGIPSSGDLFNWTEEYTITFRAYGVPFWQDATATTATIAAADEGSGSITVPGTTETVCNAEITNASGGTIDTMAVTIGSSSFSFTGLGLANGEKLVIGHQNNGVLFIRIYNGNLYRDAYGKRTGGSDDLYANPGSNDITITGGSVTATVSCYGRYL